MRTILTKLNLLILFSIFCLLGSGNTPSRFGNGMAAYKAGNYKLALEIWHPLAVKGDAEAQFLVGTIYDLGEGVPQNLSTAAKWYLKAANQKHVTAEYNLAWMYRFGKGVLKDHKKALKLFMSSADKGLAIAQFSLGSMYRFGEGTPRNLILAHSWTNIASMQGNYAASRNKKDIEKEMNQLQIEEAIRIANLCQLNNFLGCVALATD